MHIGARKLTNLASVIQLLSVNRRAVRLTRLGNVVAALDLRVWVPPRAKAYFKEFGVGGGIFEKESVNRNENTEIAISCILVNSILHNSEYYYKSECFTCNPLVFQ